MKKYGFLIIMTMIVLAVLCAVWHLETDTPEQFGVEIVPGGEKIEIWEDVGDRFYVFLPGYAQLSDARMVVKSETPVYIDGNLLEDGAECGGFSLNTEYALEYTEDGTVRKKTITFMQSGGVAAMYIDTQSGGMEYIHEDKNNEEAGSLRLYTKDGAVNYAGNLLSIHGRGNTSWTDTEKKSYNLKLLQDADLLGMGSAQNWILQANAFDTSNLRNKIVYDFAANFGLMFSPDSQWIDLYLNGEYAGLYLLCERNEVHHERVNISREDSFLVAMEREERLIAQNYLFFKTEADLSLRIHYPKKLSGYELDMLSAKWQSVENALIAKSGIDPVTEKYWTDLIDLDSWAKKYLMEEVFCSIDGGILSQFFYWDGNDPAGKLYAGPVWDFDKSMGTLLQWEILDPVTLYANQRHSGLNYHLYQKDEFYTRVIELYQDIVMPRLEKLLKDGLQDYADIIASAAMMNQIRWKVSGNSFWEEVEYIRGYMYERMQFLKSLWCDQVTYCYVYAEYGYGCCYAVLPGECLSRLYEFEDLVDANFVGWYYAGTEEPFDKNKPITEDVYIYAKWKDATRYDENGNLLSGIVEEDGKRYYYENGRGAEKGLFEYEGDYYFAMYKGELITDQEYYAWMTSCDLPEGLYEFGPDGRMLEGIVEKNGILYYYEYGKGIEKGLFKYEDAYYFSMYGGELIAEQTYYAWMTSCDLPEGFYDFGPDGKVIQ